MNGTQKHSWLIFIAAIVLVGLWGISRYNYLLFHTVAELFSIVVACCIFVVAWNSRHVAENGYLLFLGIAYLFVAALDLLHTLAYQGMGVFQGYGSNPAAQLWIAARYVESGSLMIAPLLVGRRLKGKFVLISYAAITALLLASVFKWAVFPACFVDGAGLTLFKQVSEYVIILILAVSVGLLLRKRNEFAPDVLWLLIGSVAVAMASEFVFALYRDVTGLSSLSGHYLKIVSFYLIYKAVVTTGLARPVALLFKDLKQREEALRASESRFRQLAETVHDAFWLGTAGTGGRGEILYVSPAFEEIFGIPAEEIYKSDEPWLNMVHDDDRDQVLEAMEGFVLGRADYDIEYRIVREHGEIRWIWAKGYPIRNEAGQIVRTAGVARDVTERKQAEENLRRAREETARLARFPAEDPNPVLRISGDGTILYANDASDIVLETWHCQVGERLPEPCIQRAIDVVASDKVSRFEFECHDGTSLLVTLAPAAGEGYLNAYGIDITDRRRATEALKAEIEFTETALNTQSDTFFVFEPSTGRAIRWNEAFRAKSGYSDEEIRSLKAPDSYYTHEDLKQAAAATEKILKEGMATVELTLITKDGRAIPTEYTGSVITDEQGDPKYIIAVGRDVTERKRSEEALRRSERRFRTLVEGLGQGYVVFMHDIDGKVTYVSPSIETFIGVKPELVVGRHWQEYVAWTEEGLAAGRKWGRKIRETGEPSEPFVMSYKRNGATRHLEVAERPSFDDAGDVIGIEGIAKDVTEQVRATEALRRAREALEERYALTVAASLDGLWDWDISSGRVEYSDRFAELLGYAPDEVRHTLDFFRDALHPADAEAARAAMERHLANGTPYDVEFRLRAQTGEYRWFRSRGQAQWDAAGRPTRMAGSHQDITDRKEIEERYRAVVETQTEMICRALPDTTLTFVNGAYARYFGKTPEELVGTRYLTLIPRQRRQDTLDELSSLRPDCPVKTWEHEVLRPDGSKMWNEWTNQGFFDSEGRVVEYQSVGRDITARRLAEDRLRETELLSGTILASLQDHVAVLDTTGRLIAVNDAWMRFAEKNGALERQRVSVGANYLEACRQGMRDGEPAARAALAGIEAVLDGSKDEFAMEYECSSPGEQRWFALTALPLRKPTGGAVVSHRNVTERKRAEESLRQSRNRLVEAQRIAHLGSWEWDIAANKLSWSDEVYRIFGLKDQEFDATYDAFLARVHPDDRATVEEAARTSLADPGEVHTIQYRIVRPDGVERTVHQRGSVTFDQAGRPLRRIGTVQDITDRKQAEEQLQQSYAEITQLKDNLQARLEFESLVSELSVRFVNVAPDEVDGEIERALRRISEFFHVDRCILWRVLPDRQDVRVTHMVAMGDVKLLPADFQAADRFPWSFDEVIRKGKAVCVNALDDLPAEATMDRASYEAWGTKSVLLIPLLLGGVVEYIISISSVERARTWPEEHIPRLRLLGETFANALIRKRAEEELAKNREALHHLAGRLLSVQEEERRRLARELHDDLTQRLAILAIEIGKLEQQGSVPPEMASKLGQIRERTVDLSADVHDISRQLHPSIIEDLGLQQAIRAECANFTKREGIEIRYAPADLPQGIPTATALCLFRIVQEGLRNIGKYARAKEAHVSLVGGDREIRLTIKDSGAGFDTARTGGSLGLGLASMRERVRLIGGSLSVESAPGKGTEIKVAAPLSGRENNGQADNHTGR